MNGMQKCTKKKISSEYDARIIRDRMQLKENQLFKYYFHDACNSWHVAHLISKHKVSQMLNDNYIRPWNKTILYNKEKE